MILICFYSVSMDGVKFLSCRVYVLTVLNNFKLCFICFVFRPSINLQTRSGWETCRLLPGEIIWINLTLRLLLLFKVWQSVSIRHSWWIRSLCWLLTCREAMSRMKEGEEEKTKSYTALIWTLKPIQREDITFIDDIKVRRMIVSLSVLYDATSELITTASPDSLNKCSDLRVVSWGETQQT